jgi:hypothetical protein
MIPDPGKRIDTFARVEPLEKLARQAALKSQRRQVEMMPRARMLL